MAAEIEGEAFEDVTRRISYLTRLRANPLDNSAEGLQVANYGVGGFYNFHFDYFSTEESRAKVNFLFSSSSSLNRFCFK